MPNHLHRTLPILLATCAPVAGAHAEYLIADCLLRVEGTSWQGTRVAVVSSSGASYDLLASKRRFDLVMALQDHYVISFEREGCPTKRIVFDTSVPAEVQREEFGFPFQVTLRLLTGGERFEYAGAVGYVYYSEELSRFVYDTDYRKEPSERLLALLSANSVVIAPGPVGMPVPLVATVPVDSAVAGAHDAGPARTAEPVVRMDPLSIHPVPVPVPPAPSPAPAHIRDIPAVPAVRRAAPPPAIPAPVPARRPVPRVAEPPPVRDCGTQETIEGVSYVAYITRLPAARNGACDELRKVVHAYGDVFFFRNGRSIPARRYDRLIAEPSSY